ncbi:type I polyketide synthase [Amycolatopsis australiensis]|uniref:6-deoxyerythronolide-B synthase n=1 Tax=Amycolatopsis australiensis TaxID=546364 RepID=A0A1K1SW74_9PSEU|nr:type I polyketide synthase [Amycolatopsis australiensis]SFW88484.1 Acyl transferase domain-containing protein [Amycolatopsis australiensis]
MTTEARYLDYLKRATADLRETRRLLREAESRNTEPVAIVSMSCRYPGGAASPEQLWSLVEAETDAISAFPADRGWDLQAMSAPGAGFVTEGGFLHDAAEFDAALFGISPREALAMDPQQRLVLEASWEVLERAGLDPTSLRGSRTGVFTGVMYHDYTVGVRAVPEQSAGFLSTGNAGSVVSGRVSYTFGFEGPAVTVDTACSSSLVALHLAVQAVRQRECSLALAGGVAVMATPGTFVDFSRQGGMDPSGRSKSFAASADGTAWSEGVGVLLAERLSDAQRNGHPILAVVRGTAVNQDGASSGLTAPNGPSQQRVIRQALANAHLAAEQVDLVEAHGTGTRLGDPIEAQALIATYGRDRDRPLWLGSIKSNIGHTQAAAGVAGVIKVVEAIRHGRLPKTLHVDEPTPQVDWSAGAVELLTEARDWPETGRPRRAGVSSFGISGTNAHVIIEAPPAVGAAEAAEFAEPAAAAGVAVAAGPTEPARSAPPVVPWVLSSKSEAGLQAQARRLGRWTTANSSPADLGFSLATSRAALDYRAVVLGADRDELLAGVRSVAAGETGDGVVSGVAGLSGAGPVLVFPGQGAQWVGMAVELLDSSEVFAARWAECEAALSCFVDWSLTEVARSDDPSVLERVDVVQPLLWAVMVSLAELWRSAGVEPAAVIGHSQGEIAAAVVAGALSTTDGARVVALRARAITELAGTGGMLSVPLPAAEVEQDLDPRLGIAAVNGPSATVISGEVAALDEARKQWEAQGIRVRRVPVDYASHSPQVEAIRDRILQDLAPVNPSSVDTVFFSTLTGTQIDTAELTAGYWYRNLRATVRFEDATEAAITAGHTVFIESSPHPVLTVGIQQTLDERDVTGAVLPTLRRDHGSLRQVYRAFAEAYVRGTTVAWEKLTPGHRVDLPTYAFQRERFWLPTAVEAPEAPAPRMSGSLEDRFWDAVERGDLTGLAETLDLPDGDQLGSVVPALSAWHRKHRESAMLDQWRYRVTWKGIGTPAGRLGGTWLVLDPGTRVTAAVVAALEEGGATPRVLEIGDWDRAALATQLTEAVAEHRPAGVVSLAALAEGRRDGCVVAPRSLTDTLSTVQALGDAGITAPLWCLTTGAVRAEAGEPVRNPVQATAWGLGRVAGLEHPDRWGGLIDLPAEPDERTRHALAAVLSGAPEEDQVALRASGTYVRRLVRAPRTRLPGAVAWRPEGTVVVSGGTGPLGSHVARWLAALGADHLVLLSRRGPAAPGAEELRAELTEAGTRVTIAACDVADREALRAVLAKAGPLSAVFHTAAALDDAVVAGLTADQADRVLLPKLRGAVNLRELTADQPLSALVFFSSMAGTFGASGQGNYAPGNAFLDAYAQALRAEGVPATSIAWGPWAGAGMAESGIGELARRHGVPEMAPERALAVLHQAVEDGEDALGVLDIDWDRYYVAYTATNPTKLFDELPEVRRPAVTAKAEQAPSSDLGRRLAGRNRADQVRLLTELVGAQVATVLGYASAGTVREDQAFSDVGFDSVTAVELRNRLAAATGLKLPATLVFDYPTPSALAKHLRAELLGGGDAPVAAEAAAVADDPIAIVAMSCRFPGGVGSPEELWALLAEGREGIGPFPADRGWDLDALARVSPDGTNTLEGGFLTDVSAFDAGFFGISPREALAMDPQQRLLLEVAWETLERAGIDPAALRGSRTGVFAGTNGQDYAGFLASVAKDVAGYIGTGNAASVLSGRVSYAFGFEGPTVTVDTACSSSLVAMHLAAQSLRAGECSLALAGGVTVMITPTLFLEVNENNSVAADNRCKAFADSADGAGFSEGIGLLLLERLSDAERNGHPVLAVLRGSAVNSDGASNGLTAPNGPSQQRVIRQALAAAGLSTQDVDVVEAHGTGTKLGDPIEAQALLATYGQDREHPLLLGSVKSNLGHTQAAAGVAGVLKVVLALRHSLLPKTLHVDTPSSRVDWSAGSVELLTEARPWPDAGRPRRAGVSSFGIGGTNAHLIIEAAAPAPAAPAAEEPATVPLVLSARTAPALRAQAARLRALLAEPGASPAELGRALVTTRAAFEHRAAVVDDDPATLRDGLDALANGLPATNLVTGTAGATAAGKVVFVFPGQGSQWAGMAVGLLADSAVFRAELTACDAAVREVTGWSVVDVLTDVPGTPGLDRIDVLQPVLFSVMVSLARLWESFGVRPDAVAGHSQGEVAAAYLAGALSLPDAARVISVRSRAMTEVWGQGEMMSLALSAEEVGARIAKWGDAISLAVVNSPSSVVVCGDGGKLAELAAECEADGVRVRKVRGANAAGHSPAVDVLREPLLRDLAVLRPAAAEVPFYSTVTGAVLTEPADAAYWCRNMREPVRFEDVTRALIADGHTLFVELSPHPLLASAIQETAQDAGAAVLTFGSLRRDEGGLRRFTRSLAEAHVRGLPVDLARVFGEGAVPELPTYAFQRERYWPEATAATAAVTAHSPDEARFWSAVDSGDSGAVAGTLAIDDSEALRALVPALSAWRRDRLEKSVVDDWRYRTVWRPLPAAAGAALSGTWLVVTPPGVDASAYAGALARHGAEPVTLELRPDEPFEAPAAEVDGVLSLLALDPAGLAAAPATLAATAALLTAVDAPLWTVTRGAVSVGRADRLTAPEQAPAWGLGRVAAQEHPDRWGGLIDLPAEFDDRAGDRLAAVLTGTEDQVAIRASGVFGHRLVRDRVAGQAPAREWQPHGTVLVTGGTGAVGAHIARWLARSGAEGLVLLGRRGPAAPGAAKLAAELTALGAEVAVVACDVTDREALAAVLDAIPAERPLTAVLHAAAVLDDGVLDRLDAGRFETVLRPKALAAAVLHEATRALDLDAFVLFSSVAGTLGNSGQAGYAAANAYLDALAVARRAEGLPATSIGWGAWAGSRATEGVAGQTRTRRGAAGAMEPAMAITAMATALAHDDTAVVLADLDWTRLGPALTAGRPNPLVAELVTAAPGGEPAGDEGLAGRLAAIPPSERADAVLEFVRAQAAAVLGHASADAVEPDRPFRDLGFDSLTAVEFRNILGAATGLRLPVTLVFDHPTPLAVAGQVLERAFGAGEPVRAPVPASAAADEPIAIVAMGCRLPGGIRSPEDLWRLLADGGDAVGPFPEERGWDIDRIFDPERSKPGTTYVREGGFLADPGEFDPTLFRVSPREALTMDPQQRLLLEIAWEVFERAGLDPRSLRGSETGVYVGTNYQDYPALLHQAGGTDEGFMVTGGAASVVSGRLSYTFGLEGPAVTVDTACSASLVALHLAAQALRQGECSLALAGGATVMATPMLFVGMSAQGGLAADGRCKPFAGAADGTGWGEGAGLVLLERLSDAQRNGHPVLALVRGSAVNQDGASNGISAPSGPAQQRVIRQALAGAGLSTQDVDAVEAHGTATTLGDPIEAQALLATYGQDRPEPLLLGSVKSNLGHTQAAAGITGVLKMVLALRNGLLPKTLHVDEPTPYVDWTAGNVRLLTEAQPWPDHGRPRRAGVSAFGVGGTNAHAILEQAPEPAGPPAATEAGELAVTPWPLSGDSPAALRAQARELREHLLGHGDLRAADVGHTLATARAALGHRAVVTGADRDELLDGLAAVAAGLPAASVVTGTASGRGKPVVLFSGQGSQRIGMGRELAAASGVFADELDAVCAHLDQHLDRPLREVMWSGTPEELDRTEYAQAALFAVEVAQFRLLERWGLRPGALAGHSIGELTAAYVAGVFSLEDAAALVAARGRLMQTLPGGGAMLAVQASEEEITAAIGGTGLDVAAVNGPASVVVSGDEDAVAAFEAAWRVRGRKTRRLRVSHAFHSARMDAMLAGFAEAAAKVTYHAPKIPVVSNVTGEPAGETDLVTPEYWVRHVRGTVRFADGVRAAARLHAGPFVELGPDGVLTALAQETLGADERVFVAAQRADRPEFAAFLLAAGRLQATGSAVDWTEVFAPAKPHPVPLPTYPFQHETFWPEIVHAGSRAAVDRLLYRVGWRRIDLAAGKPAGRWLLVLPEGDVEPAATARAALDAETTELRMGTESRAELAARLTGLGAFDGVLSLLALDEEPAPIVPRGAAATLRLIQALGDAGVGAPLWLLTEGAVAVGGGDVVTGPAQAMAWGFGKTLGLEQPARWGGLVDVSAGVAAGQLAAVLAGAGDEDQLAVRSDGVYVRRLARAPLGPRGEPWTSRGTALITGGTGGLGAEVAKWLARGGAEHLVLTSRRGPAAAGVAELEAELTGLGTRVTVVACDVADRDALARVLADVGGEVRTVVHAAGISLNNPIAATTDAELEAVAAAKLAGAVHLDELLGDRDLDAFVLFSSISSTWGSGAQAGYGAANAFLDAFAHWRRARGRTATSIAWGAWGDVGMVNLAGNAEAARRLGLALMPPSAAIAALAAALDQDETTVTVADVDWATFAPSFTLARRRPLLDDLPEVRAAADGDTAADGVAEQLRGRLATMSGADRTRALAELVGAHIAAVLGYAGAGAVEPGRSFRELGVDSLTAVELRNQIGAATGLRLPATLVFDHPTPADVVDFVRDELLRDGDEGRTVIDDLDRVDAALDADLPVGDRRLVVARLRSLLARFDDDTETGGSGLDTATDDELFALVDHDLGLS